MNITEQPTLRMHAITARRPVYPRPRRRTAFLGRLACLLLIIAILAVSGLLYFSTPSSIGWFRVEPTPTVAPCARVTLIRGANGQFTTAIDEVCK